MFLRLFKCDAKEAREGAPALLYRIPGDERRRETSVAADPAWRESLGISFWFDVKTNSCPEAVEASNLLLEE